MPTYYNAHHAPLIVNDKAVAPGKPHEFSSKALVGPEWSKEAPEWSKEAPEEMPEAARRGKKGRQDNHGSDPEPEPEESEQ